MVAWAHDQARWFGDDHRYQVFISARLARGVHGPPIELNITAQVFTSYCLPTVSCPLPTVSWLSQPASGRPAGRQQRRAAPIMDSWCVCLCAPTLIKFNCALPQVEGDRPRACVVHCWCSSLPHSSWLLIDLNAPCPWISCN